MYKIYTKSVRIPSGYAHKFLLVMKLTTILLFAAIMQVSASGFAQVMTFTKKKATLEQVFNEIKKQTGYRVFYSDQIIDDTSIIDVDFKNASINEVMTKCLEHESLTYILQTNKSIVVKEKEFSFLDKLVSHIRTVAIHGRVLDETGKPLSAVSVRIKGTKNASITSADGRFAINVPTENTILVFSFVGYITKEMTAKYDMVVSILPDLNKLNEMVVVGYGSTRRKDLTGSVASVDMTEVKNVPFATVDQVLTGKAAGVQVVQSDGSPGGVAKIRIRGGTSLLGGNDPLYIIDGVPVAIQNRYLQGAADIVSPIERTGNDDPDGTVSASFSRGLNSLGGLNINDIESIDILKDASATAIYGSRAANGVVIITTKKGKLNQKPVLEVNYYSGMSRPLKEKRLNSNQYTTIMKEAAKNLNDSRAERSEAPDPVASNILNNPSFLGTANTDWLDLILRNGITQNADISVRGGGTGSRYYTSLAYNKNNGVLRGTDYTRIAGKISLDNEITSKLSVSTNLNYGFTTNNITNGIYSQAMFAPPTMDPYNADGSVKIIDAAATGAYAYEGFQNPLFLLKGINKANTVSLVGSLAATYDIIKDLKFRSTVSVNYNNYHQTNYIPSNVLVASSAGVGSSGNGTATQGQSQDVSSFVENTINWDKEFNEHNRLNLLAGTSWQITKTNSFSASGQGFPDDEYLNNLSSAAVTLPATGLAGQNSLLSFYMRANYSLYEKYLFTFTGRSDASSKFPANNRIGYFPSAGVAWRISQENFLKGVKWIDDIKLRMSAGYTGTQNIGDNLFYTLYSPVSYAGTNGLTPSQLGNDKIKWESTLQKDLGLDFQFFNSRLGGTVGYYEKATSGILFPTTVARSSGFDNVTANIADIRNRGLELTIRGTFIRKKDFEWSGTFNISGNRSKVLALSNDFADPANPTVYNYGNTVLKVGEPVGLLYGRVFDGLLQTQAEVDAYKKASIYAAFGYYPYLGIGDARYVMDAAEFGDFKNDVIGHAEPKYYGGYTNSLTYKNFNLITLATFSKGGDIYYVADGQNQSVTNRTNKGVHILDRWTPENTNTTVPRLVYGQSSYASLGSNNVYDASFLKLKSVTLSYQFAKSMLDRLRLSSASLYVSATNLITITHYPGADPEISNNPYSLIGGYSDSGGYPTVKQYSLGLRFGF